MALSPYLFFTFSESSTPKEGSYFITQSKWAGGSTLSFVHCNCSASSFVNPVAATQPSIGTVLYFWTSKWCIRHVWNWWELAEGMEGGRVWMMPKIPRARRKRQWGVRGHRSPTSHFSLHSLSISLFSSHELCRKPVIQTVCTLHHAAVSAYLNLNSFTLHWQLRNYNFVRRVAFPCPTSQKKIYLTPLIGSRLHRRYAFDPTK
jgi:hypothetical protein